MELCRPLFVAFWVSCLVAYENACEHLVVAGYVT